VPDPATADRLLAAAAAVEPRLAGVAVLEHRVGLRPGRPYVRLEAEVLADGRQVVHNYGHGGAGVSLSWGCAAEAARLALGVLA
jgi:D-amino-acid oxidase